MRILYKIFFKCTQNFQHVSEKILNKIWKNSEKMCDKLLIIFQENFWHILKSFYRNCIIKNFLWNFV